MATFHRKPDGGVVAYVKGALAFRELSAGEDVGPQSIRDLTFVGLAGMLDPPAEGVRETIRRFREAGVRTVMITGDQAITAQAVARDLGLLGEGDQTMHGGELPGVSEDELTERVARVAAFSRVSPADELRIVKAYQRRGDIVGMLGDGVNDAAALKRADIGVAMGLRGTDVAKETADLVLQDDRFETIGVAVEDGRVIFDNIRKFIFYLFSCNVSEVATLLLAGLIGMPLPLLPLQILWLNLITDVFPTLIGMGLESVGCDDTAGFLPKKWPRPAPAERSSAATLTQRSGSRSPRN